MGKESKHYIPQITLLGLERGLVQSRPLIYHTKGWRKQEAMRQSNLNDFMGSLQLQGLVCSGAEKSQHRLNPQF